MSMPVDARSRREKLLQQVSRAFSRTSCWSRITSATSATSTSIAFTRDRRRTLLRNERPASPDLHRSAVQGASPCAWPRRRHRYLLSDGGEWEPFARVASKDALTTRAIEFSDDGKDCTGWTRAGATRLRSWRRIWRAAAAVLAEDARADFRVCSRRRQPASIGGRVDFIAPELARARPGLRRRFRRDRDTVLR